MSARLPETAEEWRHCVDLAHGLLAIESARQYGLIEGGPHCDVERCQEILTLGAEKGFIPSEDAVASTIKGLHDAVQE